jgi:alpha-L-rhamnosidase
MGKVDRRTFLKQGLRTGAVVAAAGTVGFEEWAVLQPSNATAASLRGAPTGLNANGLTSAVGLDPDDLSFAWELSDSKKSALQSAYRLILSHKGGGTVWDSGEVSSPQQSFVEYTGPTLAADTAYDFTIETRDEALKWSPRSQPVTFLTGLREVDWRAKWLRPGPADTGVEQYTYLRKEISLPPGAIAHATVYTAAAHKYQLWINGVKADTGPSFCYPDEQYFQATDVGDLVRPGSPNAVGFLHHWYSAGKARPTSMPGLLAQLSVVYADGRRIIIGTDGTWKQRRAEWLPSPQRNTDGGDFIETIDGRQTPLGWSEPSYDDGSWQQAPEIGPVGSRPFTGLYGLKTRIEEIPIPAVTVKTLEGGAVIVDFGKVYAARPTVEFLSGVTGRMIPMHVGYVLDPDGHVSTLHATQATNLAFYYIERDGRQKFDPYTFLGFRYLEIDDPGESITSAQVVAMARHCVMPEVPQASFTSSNPGLDAVWDLCARSALYATHEQFVDTPTREKGQFLWDSCNESQVVMRVHREQNLTYQALRDIARSQKRFWPDGRVNDIYPTGYGAQSYVSFTALYPEWVWRYFLNTGDRKGLSELFSTVKGVSDYLWRGVKSRTGLVTGMPLYPSADSNYNYDFNTDADISINTLSANVFARVALMAGILGDMTESQLQQTRSKTIADAINHYLVRPDGIYVDGLRADGTQSSVASQLANIQPLAYGIVPDTRKKVVGEYVASLGISVEPDHGMELLRALHAAGLDNEVVETLTNASRPGWAWILAHGGTFCWEAWQLSDVIGDSMSHGWGSAALVAMQEILLGINPIVPGFGDPPTMLDISPAFGLIENAHGTFPTFAGTGAVGWSRSGGPLSVDLTLPPNSAAHLRLPATSDANVTVDKSPLSRSEGVKAISASNGELMVRVGSGSYTFNVS